MKSRQPILTQNSPKLIPSALPRQTLVTTVVNILRKRILGGEFVEGEPLNQVAIAREYDISRIPLREAMRQLEAEGLLLFQPGKGAVIPSLSLQQIEEVIDLRTKLEPELLAKAIPYLTIASLDEASSILDQFDVALKGHNVAIWGELNWRFHSTLYVASGCSLTMAIVQGLHHQNERYARIQISLNKWEQRAAREHRALLAACRRKDRRKASQLLKDHISSAGEALVDALNEQRNARIRQTEAR